MADERRRRKVTTLACRRRKRRVKRWHGGRREKRISCKRCAGGSTGHVCCVTFGGAGTMESCGSSCPDGGATVGCNGPENCTAAAQYCCGTINVGPGTPPNCPVESVETKCTTKCNTMLKA